jgi:predicted ester cyclase
MIARDGVQPPAITPTDLNKTVVTQGKLPLVDELFTSSFTINGQTATPEGIKQWVTSVRAAFPDVQVFIEDQVAEGDRVATRRTFRSTHLGEFVSPFGRVSPTGKRIAWHQLSIVRIARDQMIEDTVILDDVRLLQQLGATITLHT